MEFWYSDIEDPQVGSSPTPPLEVSEPSARERVRGALGKQSNSLHTPPIVSVVHHETFRKKSATEQPSHGASRKGMRRYERKTHGARRVFNNTKETR